MDRFRTRGHARCATHVEQRAQDDLQRARWFAFGFVVLFSATVLVARDGRAGAPGAARPRPRQAAARVRRGAAGRRRRARGQGPAAPARRAADARRDAVVLTRNASGNSLEPSTDPSAVAGTGRQADRRDAALVPGDPPRPRLHEHKPDSGAAADLRAVPPHRQRLALRARRSSAARSSARCSSSRSGRSSRSSASGSSWRCRRPPRSSPTCATSRSPSTAPRPTR